MVGHQQPRSAARRLVKLELLSRPGCHLCDEMAAVLDAALVPLGLSYAWVDVDADPALQHRYGEIVPVLLRDGRPVAKVRVSRAQVERIVRRRL